MPFEIPDSWEWANLGYIAFITKLAGFEYTKYISKNITNRGIPLFKGKNVQNGLLNEKFEAFIPEDLSDSLERSQLTKKCLLTPYVGTIGNIAIFNGNYKAHLGSNVGKIEMYTNWVIEEYTLLFLQSPEGYNQLSKYKKSTAQESISIDALRNTWIPIPPINEQKLIIDRFNILEPLIERYKIKEEQLFVLNSDIKNLLKKSILQYAIEGKLVPQDSNDEPASILLERIHKEKEKLIAEGKIKKDKNESIIYRRDNSYYEKFDNTETCLNDKLPYDLPAGWEWCNVGSLFRNSTGLSYKKDQLSKKSNSMIRVLRGGNIQDGNYTLKNDDIFISSEFVKQDLFLKKGYMITPAVTSLEHIGKIALIDKDYDNIVVGGFVLMLKPIFQYHIMLQYLLLFFSTNYHRKACRKITHKSGQAFYNLSRDKLMKLYIAIPPLDEQKRIVDKLKQITKLLEL